MSSWISLWMSLSIRRTQSEIEGWQAGHVRHIALQMPRPPYRFRSQTMSDNTMLTMMLVVIGA